MLIHQILTVKNMIPFLIFFPTRSVSRVFWQNPGTESFGHSSPIMSHDISMGVMRFSQKNKIQIVGYINVYIYVYIILYDII